MRFVATLVLFGLLALVVAASAGAATPPPAPPKFWTVSRCEQTLLGLYGDTSPLNIGGYVLPDGSGHHFHAAQATCVGSGGAHACRWITGHRSRLYAEFRVFTRSPFNGGVVRSFTLATRAGSGLVKIVHHAGDQYVGWPADFYMSPVSVRLLASNATPARFRSIVAPIAAGLTRQQNATGCAGG
jgi:hypothetical protein